MKINRVDVTVNGDGLVSALRFANAENEISEIYGLPHRNQKMPTTQLSDMKVSVRQIDYWWRGEDLAGIVFFNGSGDQICGEYLNNDQTRKESVIIEEN